MQEIHWLGSVTDDLVYLPSRVLPMMLLRPPNIPSSKFKSKLGSTPILSVLTLCNKKRERSGREPQWQESQAKPWKLCTTEQHTRCEPKLLSWSVHLQKWNCIGWQGTSDMRNLRKEWRKKPYFLGENYPGNAAEESRLSLLINVRQIP